MTHIPAYYADYYIDTMTNSLVKALEQLLDEAAACKQKADEATSDLVRMKYLSEAEGFLRAGLIIQDQLRKDGLIY